MVYPRRDAQDHGDLIGECQRNRTPRTAPCAKNPQGDFSWGVCQHRLRSNRCIMERMRAVGARHRRGANAENARRTRHYCGELGARAHHHCGGGEKLGFRAVLVQATGARRWGRCAVRCARARASSLWRRENAGFSCRRPAPSPPVERQRPGMRGRHAKARRARGPVGPQPKNSSAPSNAQLWQEEDAVTPAKGALGMVSDTLGG